MKYISSLLIILFLLSPKVNAAEPNEPDQYMLAAYIDGTRENLSLSAMTAVGNVLYNRIMSGAYPNSLIRNGELLGIFPKSPPSDMAKFAAEIVLSGKDITGGAVTFFPQEEKYLREKYSDKITFSASGLLFAKD